ncbi:hypothetical protein EC957_006765 [Mortierella hygrophila]|uniref:Uncharacterized protein n=1 Tax=Mortierella hygrophila TaxID=979708 RepID=A0A9P6JYF4_9FUNG|nr:hypothetical protein EC957_006765 [Mortierella hygrophila]
MSTSTPIQQFRVQHQNEIFNVESYYHKDTGEHLVELDDMEVILERSNRFATEARISAVFIYGQTVHVALDQRNTPMFPLSIVLRPYEILDIALEALSPVIEQNEQFPTPPMTPPPPPVNADHLGDTPVSPGAQVLANRFVWKMMAGHHQRQLHRGRLSGRYTDAQLEGISRSLSHAHRENEITELKNLIRQGAQHTDMRFDQMTQQLQQNNQHIHQHIQQGNQETLQCLGLVQQQVQSIQRQNYELFEFTTPRLFIILPMKEQDCFVKKFRIYFLCECDDHQGWTHRGDSQVHVANHGGYELERPTEFFRKYGKQVVKFMNFLKYAVMAAGVAVPVLAQVGFIEGLDNTAKFIRDISEDLVGKADFVIDHLKKIGEYDITTSSDRPPNHVIGQDILSSVEPLTGPELRQLQTFLRAKDGDNVYANLHKIVTPEGHVRWVCAHHRQEAERPISMATLHEFLKRAGGHFDIDTGVLVMFLSTRQDARELYSYIHKFKFIHQLTVSFEWQILESDLFELKDAIALSSIRHLDLDGERYNGSWDPVLTIMAIPKLQVLSVKKFRGFLQNTTWWPNDAQLRSLDFSDQPITDATAQKVVVACPFLATLTLSTTDIKSTFDNVRHTAEQHGSLATLTIRQSDPSQPSNADKPSVAYYFDKGQRTVLSATLTLRTQFYGNLIQLPMIKKVAYRPIVSGDQRVFNKAKQTALILVKRFTEMESFEYQCHFNHFRDLFTAIKQEHLAIKEQPYQISVLRRVKLVDEHGSFLTSQNIQDQTAIRYNYEEASRLVQDGAPDPRGGGLQRDPHGTSRGSIGAQRPQASIQRAQFGGSVNHGRPVFTPAHIPYALPIYTTIDSGLSLPVPTVHSQGSVGFQSTPSSTEGDGSRMRTMVFDTFLTYPRIREIRDSIDARGHSALERMIWDITDLNNVRILKDVLAILGAAQTPNGSGKPATEIRIRLVSGMSNLVGGRGGGGGGIGEGNINNVSQPGLSNLLSSADRSYLCILFTTHVTRLELFGRDLDTFLPRLCESYDWTMSELRELVVDGKGNHLNKASLDYLRDIVRRVPDDSTPATKTLRPAQPLQLIIIQNMRLFDVQWSQLLASLDWITLRHISFRGSDFKHGQLVELQTSVIQLVERCREKQRVLSLDGLSSRDAVMLTDLMVRQSGDAHLLVSLYQTNVTVDQIQETQEKLYKRGIHWCLFTLSDL